MQRRRLLRAPGLGAFRETLIACALEGDPSAIRARACVLPTRGAIELFRRAIEDERLSTGGAVVLPHLLTREDWVAWLAAVAGGVSAPSRVEREVIMESAARAAAVEVPPPFGLRPGLIAAILDFYDELRRRGRTVTRFAEVLATELAGADASDDRGSAELLRQTAFLTAVFTRYEAHPAAAGDEHRVRERLLREGPVPGVGLVEHVVVAVADHPSDPRGLWPADFDLLGRLPWIEQLDIVVTDDTHDAGFRERIDREIPDLEDVRVGQAATRPTLITRTEGVRTTDYRDREEEVRAVARSVRMSATFDAAAPLSSTAVVFQKPLPYLYLAEQVFAEAGVPFQAFDALPLSAEPYAALLDLALVVARTGGTRDSVTALLRSPLIQVSEGDTPVTLDDVAALDRVLVEGRVTVAPERFADAVAPLLAAERRPDGPRAARVRRAARAASAVATALAGFRTAATASAQVGTLASWLRDVERPVVAEVRDRHVRARAAVLGLVEALAEAHRRHDDTPRDPSALAASLHHLIERHTFTPRRGTTGVQLVDAVAARFGAFDHVYVVGLVDAEWPERQRRTIFYTSSLLSDLGWPSEPDHLRAQQAAFRDLIGLPARTLTLSAFQLEGEAVVAATPLADDARTLTERVVPLLETRVFADERLALAPVAPGGLPPDAMAWLALREARPPLSDPAYRGTTGPQAPREYRVSTLDRYVECPFKYFAGVVLRLDEEIEEDSALSPRDRGTLLHGVFEQFYREWDGAGRGAISQETVGEAIARFERLAAEALAPLPEADRLIETARLLGSIVTRGAAERVFALEADDGRAVVRRWLEQSLHGTYPFPAGFAPPRPIAIRGVADRIDEMADGTLRVIDYKLTRPPRAGAVQLKVYAYVAPQQLTATEGRSFTVSAAEYVSFGDDSLPATPVAGRGESVTQAVEAGAQAFATHVGKIESGAFPPSPARAELCEWCAFASVCRKETVAGEGEDDAAAESV